MIHGLETSKDKFCALGAGCCLIFVLSLLENIYLNFLHWKINSRSRKLSRIYNKKRQTLIRKIHATIKTHEKC